MKIKELLKTRMKSVIDKTVLVPIEDTEVMNTMQTLPRNLDDSTVVGIDFKRMESMKNIHFKGFLRPTKMVTLKVLGNLHYQTIIKKCMYCLRQFDDDDKDMLDHVKQRLLRSQVNYEDLTNNRDKGIDKDEMKNLIRPKIMAS